MGSYETTEHSIPIWTNLDLDQCMIDLNQHPNHIYNQKLPIFSSMTFFVAKIANTGFPKEVSEFSALLESLPTLGLDFSSLRV